MRTTANMLIRADDLLASALHEATLEDLSAADRGTLLDAGMAMQRDLAMEGGRLFEIMKRADVACATKETP